eukprot:g1011.t1
MVSKPSSNGLNRTQSSMDALADVFLLASRVPSEALLGFEKPLQKSSSPKPKIRSRNLPSFSRDNDENGFKSDTSNDSYDGDHAVLFHPLAKLNESSRRPLYSQNLKTSRKSLKHRQKKSSDKLLRRKTTDDRKRRQSRDRRYNTSKAKTKNKGLPKTKKSIKKENKKEDRLAKYKNDSTVITTHVLSPAKARKRNTVTASRHYNSLDAKKTNITNKKSKQKTTKKLLKRLSSRSIIQQRLLERMHERGRDRQEEKSLPIVSSKARRRSAVISTQKKKKPTTTTISDADAANNMMVNNNKVVTVVTLELKKKMKSKINLNNARSHPSSDDQSTNAAGLPIQMNEKIIKPLVKDNKSHESERLLQLVEPLTITKKRKNTTIMFGNENTVSTSARIIAKSSQNGLVVRKKRKKTQGVASDMKQKRRMHWLEAQRKVFEQFAMQKRQREAKKEAEAKLRSSKE